MSNDDKKINELLSHYTIDPCEKDLQSKVMQRIEQNTVNTFAPFFSWKKPAMVFASVIVCGLLLVSLLPNTNSPVMDAETFLHTALDPQIEEMEMAMIVAEDQEIDEFLNEILGSI